MHTAGQKYKILVLYRILMEKSDEEHQLNAAELIEFLKEEEITAERKVIYKDIDTLVDSGVDIVKGKKGYYVASRTFELPELKLLVDAVSASKFISEKKSRSLVKKIASLASVSEASQLSRQVIVPDRVKTENEKIFYTIDTVYNCIENNLMMSFKYEDWTVEKKKVLRHKGEEYLVSPAFLIRNDENYYLVAFDEKSREIRHYRVDKIVDANSTSEKRGGYEERKALVPEEYAKQHVSMFAGDQTTITISCNEKLVGVLLDKFGTEISIRKTADGKINARIQVAVSPQLYGWVTGVGAIITAPEDEAQKYKEYLLKLLESY